MTAHHPKHIPTQTNLFDTPSGWVDSPDEAFVEWMGKAIEPVASNSLIVYRAMWRKFFTWVGSHGIDLTTCTSTDVASFLASIHVSPLHEQRYLRILARVWGHLAEIGLPVLENVGKREKRKKAHRGESITPHTTSFLSSQDIQRLHGVLQEVFARPLPPAGIEGKGDEWIERRDAAMVGVMIGAGMKLNEVLRWSYSVNRTAPGEPAPNMPDDVSAENPLQDVGDWLQLPRFGAVPARRVYLFPIGQEALRAWGQCHVHYNFEPVVQPYGKTVYRIIFPADIARRWSVRRHATRHLDARNAWRRISTLLERAMIPGKLATTQALRNTYVALLLQEGYSDASISEYLGLLREVSATRIRMARDGQPRATM